MTVSDPVARIVGLVKKYSPKLNSASFRKDYRDGVSRALATKLINEEGSDLLARARSYLETWASETPPSSAEAWRQWIDLYDAGRDVLPDSLLAAFLGRFPKSAAKDADWGALVFSDADKGLLRLLLTRGFIRAVEFNRMAKSRPAEFYRSAALDLLLERGTPPPRTVWEALGKGDTRPPGLMTADEALVRSFRVDIRPAAEQWLVSFLSTSDPVRRVVLRNMLRDMAASARLANHLVPTYSRTRKTRGKQKEGGSTLVLIDWLEICAEVLEADGGSAMGAAMVLSLAQLGAIANPTRIAPNALAVLSDVTRRVAQPMIVRALRNAELEGEAGAASFALMVRGNDLYRAVQEYLRRLPSGAKDNLESPERALRFERYAGRRELVQSLLTAMDAVPGNGPLRDAVEAALFNAGVRTFGALGEEVSYDAHSHQPEASGIMPGNRVVVTRAGRRLGDETDAVVIAKARVKPL